MKKSLGFTLIEIIAVVAILAILSGVGIVKMFEITADARVSVIKQMGNQLKSAVRDLHVNLVLQGKENNLNEIVTIAPGRTVWAHRGYPLLWVGNDAADMAITMSYFFGTKLTHEDHAGPNIAPTELLVIYGILSPGQLQVRVVPNYFYDTRATVNCYARYTITTNANIHSLTTETSDC